MKGMTITYEVGNSLYLNITNRCSNRCDFCIRQNGDGAYGSNSLWLEREPTEEEILAAVDARDVKKYDEVIFCGYGEPTERLDTLVHVAKALKAKYGCKIRVNTNGQSDLIHGRDTSSLFAGAVDTLSISLNAPNAAEYQRVCHSPASVRMPTARFWTSHHMSSTMFRMSCCRLWMQRSHRTRSGSARRLQSRRAFRSVCGSISEKMHECAADGGCL